MLWEKTGNFFGIKTGITPSAGPCLCVNYKDGEFDIIAVVLHCKSREARFIEIPKLINWAINKIIKIRKTPMDPVVKVRLLRNMAHV